MTATSATAALPLPRESARARVDATLGMLFFIGSWSMAFGTLFLSFLILRDRVGTWPPPGIALPSFPLASLATAVLLGSSVALHLALRRARAGRQATGAGTGATAAAARGFGALWAVGLGLGCAFAALQWWLWWALLAAGTRPEAGLYESLFFGLTWVHAAHVAIALLALLWVQVGIACGRYGSQRIVVAQNSALFWHFMDAVWVLLYLGFFVF